MEMCSQENTTAVTEKMWTNEKHARDFELGREHAEIPPLPKEEKRGRTQPYVKFCTHACIAYQTSINLNDHT